MNGTNFTEEVAVQAATGVSAAATRLRVHRERHAARVARSKFARQHEQSAQSFQCFRSQKSRFRVASDQFLRNGFLGPLAVLIRIAGGRISETQNGQKHQK